MYQFFQGLSCNKPNIDLCTIQHSAWFWKVNFHDILCLLQDITTDNSVQQQFHQFLRCLCNHRCINPAFYEKRLKQCLPIDRQDYSFATSNASFKAILTASKLLVFGSVPAKESRLSRHARPRHPTAARQFASKWNAQKHDARKRLVQKRDCLYGSVITRYKNRKPRFYLKTGPETEPIFKNRNRHTTIYVYVYDHHWWNYNKICMRTDLMDHLPLHSFSHIIGMVPILNIFKWDGIC